jgi:hypothetical protein
MRRLELEDRMCCHLVIFWATNPVLNWINEINLVGHGLWPLNYTFYRMYNIIAQIQGGQSKHFFRGK